VRCFVAIDVPPAVREAVAGAQSALRRAAPDADVRWADTTQLHLTLKFLGAVPDERVPAVSAAVEAAVSGVAPLELAVGGLGGFPALRRARVLWAGLGGAVAELAALASAVERTVAPLGFVPEERPFHGHLTIGRVRSPRGGRALASAVEAAGAPHLGSWTAGEVVLYQSRLHPKGAVHTPVTRHPLRGARA
jgi:2'-5' RNA ligase